MICVEQWRRAIGLFSGKGIVNRGTVVKMTSLEKGPWTDFNQRLFVCALAYWGVTLGFMCVNSAQPFVNLLLLCNDIESNPGPTVEEQLERMNITMSSQLSCVQTGIDKLQASVISIHDDLAQLREDVQGLKTKLVEIEDRHNTLQLDVDANNENINKLEDRVDKIENSIEHQEQYSRRENLIFHGVPENGNETFASSRKIVVNILNSVFSGSGKRWSETDIMRAHRLGARREDRARPMIARFSNFMDKLEVFRARDELAKQNIKIVNDLTAHQRSELKRLRESGRMGYYKNGRLVIRDQEPTQSTPAHDGQDRRRLTAARRGQQHRNP